MSDYDYGPLQKYEVTWASGHIEYVEAHQVLMPGFNPGWAFHGEFDGHWRLVLFAKDGEIRSVRNLVHAPEDHS